MADDTTLMPFHVDAAPSSNPGVLHFIPGNLCLFEPSKSLMQSPATNTLLWIGGMFDTLLSVSYPLAISQSLGPDWSLMTASLSSAGNSWGVSSIAQDAEDMDDLVEFIKTMRPKGKVVLMGHSTGCQDCMEYIVGANSLTRLRVNGVILQAPVSDREAMVEDLPEAVVDEANQLALKMCREGHGKDSMPNSVTDPVFGSIAVTANRWVDVASPGPHHTGADDYFSSDLSDERLEKTFGKLRADTPLLILHGEKDEAVPSHIDKLALLERWTKVVKRHGGAVDETNSGVVEGASHNLNGNPCVVVQDLVKRVVAYIMRLDKGDFDGLDDKIVVSRR